MSPAPSTCNFLSGKKTKQNRTGQIRHRPWLCRTEASRTQQNLYLCRERPVVLVSLSGGLSSDPGCRSADWACSVAVATGAGAPDRPPAEGRHSASPPCCGRTPGPDRCDSYQLDRNDMKLPAETDKEKCLHVLWILARPWVGYCWSIYSLFQILRNFVMKCVYLGIKNRIHINNWQDAPSITLRLTEWPQQNSPIALKHFHRWGLKE